MRLLDFVTQNDIIGKKEAEKAKLLCFHHYKESGDTVFTMSKISELMMNAGFNAPNTSRLKESLTKGKNKVFLFSRVTKGTLEFIPAVLQEMELSIGKLGWILQLLFQIAS